LRSLRTLFTLVLPILFIGAPAPAQKSTPPPKPDVDVLIFTNGDQLTGHLERAVGGNVVFKSDMAGELTISIDKVKELRSGAKFAALRKGKPGQNNLVGEGDVHFAADTVTITPPSQPAVTLPIKELGFLVDAPTYDRELHHEPSFIHGWNGSITGGATLVRSTDNTTSFTAGIALARVVPSVAYLPTRNRTTFNLIETYGKATSKIIPPPPVQTPPLPTETITKTSIFHSDAERDQYFNPRFYALADAAFDHDYSQGLDLQQLYGAGIGWTAIQSAKQQLDLKADVHYEKQTFTTGPNPNIIGTIFGEAYRRNLPHTIVFTESGNFTPAWNEPSDYSAMATAALVLPTYKRLSTSLSVTDNYLNDPAPFYNRNSFQFVAGVSYALK
jgi:hypothetical protein